MAVKKATPVRQKSGEGAGGETHQTATGAERLTTNHGAVISDNQNSLRSGDRGPTLLEDFVPLHPAQFRSGDVFSQKINQP